MTSIKKTLCWRIFFYALLGANLAALIALWWTASGSFFSLGTSAALIALGRLAGLLTEFTILVQLILIARIPILEHTFGFDRMNKLHRVTGYSIAGIFIFHPLFLTTGYAMENGWGFIQQFLDFYYNWEDVGKAILGALVFGLIIFVTVFFRKKMQYEAWHTIHLLAYVGIVLAFGHQTNFGDLSHGAPYWRWLALNFIVFGLVLFYRALWPIIQFYRHRFVIEEVRQETPDIWSVIIGGRNIEKFNYHPGQFAHFFFFQKGFIWPHPFSFSHAPNGKTLRVSIKSSGDFTSRIKNLRPGTKVLIDGPLGRFTPFAAHRAKFLLVAGGVGITPIRAMAEHLAKEKSDAVLFYAARTPADFALAHEIPPHVPVHKFISEGETSQGFEKGRVTLEAIRRYAPDFGEREIYICGPKPMMDALETSLRAAGIPKKHIHTERFAF
jgi:predicted ferric reductase